MMDIGRETHGISHTLLIGQAHIALEKQRAISSGFGIIMDICRAYPKIV